MCFALNSIHYLSVLLFDISPESPYYVFLAVVIFSPTIGYFDQLRKIIMHRSSAMFNRHTAVIQLLSNYLRFIYWHFEPYKIYLFGQSIAVCSLQIISSFIAFHFRDENNENQSSFLPHMKYYQYSIPKMPHIADFLNIFQAKSSLEFFFSLIIYFIVILMIFGFLCICFGVQTAATIDIVLSNIIDTITSLPHFLQIVWYKEVENVSFVLVGQFLTGDILKMILYLFGHSAWPFIFGASLQLVLDTILVASFASQKCLAKGKKSNREPSETSTLLPK